MAANEQDPLLRLRQAIAAGHAITPSASAEAGSPEVGLAQASHLLIPTDDQAAVLPMDAATRFISNDRPVDLRSIYFAWLNRELAIPEYNAAAATLNGELEAAKVQNLGFIERLDLITWLEGASDESEYIKPLADDAAAAAAAAAAPATKAGGASAAAQARGGKGTLDPRLASIYDGERRMGDRNTVLRGIKPTVGFLPTLKHFVLKETAMVRAIKLIKTCTGLFTRAQACCALYPTQVAVDGEPGGQHGPVAQSKGPV